MSPDRIPAGAHRCQGRCCRVVVRLPAKGGHCWPGVRSGRTRHRAASAAQARPLIAPTTTSLRWCMPRYSRAYATSAGSTEHTPITVRRSHTRSMPVAMMARDA